MKSKERITADDRINLQAALTKELEMSVICRTINKNRSTIYREIKKYRIHKEGRHSCYLCSKTDNCDKKKEFRLGVQCKYFEAPLCPKLKYYPYVCNTCRQRGTCLLDKLYYDCSKAERMSQSNRVGTRRRKMLTSDEIVQIDNVVTPLVKKGESIHHIYITNPFLQDLCSERTIRRMIYDGYLHLMANELRRWSRFKHKQEYDLTINKSSEN